MLKSYIFSGNQPFFEASVTVFATYDNQPAEWSTAGSFNSRKLKYIFHVLKPRFQNCGREFPVSRACSTRKGILFNVEKFPLPSSSSDNNDGNAKARLFSNEHSAGRLFSSSNLLRNNPTCHNNHIDGAKDGNEGKQWRALALTSE